MSSGGVSPRGPPIPPRSIVDALVRLIRDQVPGIAIGAAITSQVLREVINIIEKNIVGLLGGGFIAAGLSVLLPSLAVAVVNALGWTASGVLAGSIAASIQSVIYGAFTSGAFSMLQAFGATTAIASPVGLALGSLSLVIGAGCFGYWLYRRGRRGASSGRSDGIDEATPSPPSSANTVSRRPAFNFFDLFSQKPKPKSKSD